MKSNTLLRNVHIVLVLAAGLCLATSNLRAEDNNDDFKYRPKKPPVTPIPEPATSIAALALLGALGWKERDRIRSWFCRS